MENQNLNDKFELTRGNINAIINGLAKAPAEHVYTLIAQLQALQPTTVAVVEAQSLPVVSEETKTTEQ